MFPAIGMENASKIPLVTDGVKWLTVCSKKVFPKISHVFCCNHVIKDAELWVKKQESRAEC